MLSTGTLMHGGIMVNYQCNAACRHCLYSCSPTRGQGYVGSESAEKICRILRKGGCRSVHIGGGEPFLDFNGLLVMIQKLEEAGITLEYIETNAFWALQEHGGTKPQEKMKALSALGAVTLCISVDPYHAEYIPYGVPLALAELCEKNGVDYFLWKQEFLPLLSRLDPNIAHSRAEMEKNISKTYIDQTARQYGIGYGGRAVNIDRQFGSCRHVENFAFDNSPCRNLLSTGHFHVDMDCFFIPPRCTGIRIPLTEAVSGIPEGKYPTFEALYTGGLSALLELALRYGFIPGKATVPESFPSKCNLCFHLRHFLSGMDFPELDRHHYEEALKYY